jgi:predicted metal-binding membrane protein
MEQTQRNQGLLFAAAGISAVVLAVLLFGLTTATGAIDVVSVITAVAGVALVAAGLYQAFHHPRPTTAR